MFLRRAVHYAKYQDDKAASNAFQSVLRSLLEALARRGEVHEADVSRETAMTNALKVRNHADCHAAIEMLLEAGFYPGVDFLCALDCIAQDIDSTPTH